MSLDMFRQRRGGGGLAGVLDEDAHEMRWQARRTFRRRSCLRLCPPRSGGGGQAA